MVAGVTIEKEENYALCRVEAFTPELQKKIRDELSAIALGAAEVAALPEYNNYRTTLREFLVRYNSKAEDTQKGMIGELLSHILIPELFQNLTSLSVLLNKEEQSIKKGFDIIYCDIPQSALWYSEVKSGHKAEKDSSEKANHTLVKRAYADLKEKFGEGRASLWRSALIDVSLTLDASMAANAKKLLSNDSPLVSPSISTDKNAILISVLYEPPSNCYTLNSLKVILDELLAKNEFKSLIVFSIQKETFQKIANFLEAEVAAHA